MGCHFDNIASLVKANAGHLEELELELHGWPPDHESTVMQHEDKPEVWDNIQASAVLALKTFGLEVTTSKAAEQTCFPNLRRLKLTRIPLRDESAGTQVIASSIDSSARRLLSCVLDNLPI